MAMTVIDSTAEPGLSGVRGGPDNRLVRLVGPNFDIHLKIREVGGRKTIMGQISCDPLPDHSLVVLFGDEAMRAATVDNLGEFSFEEVKAERFQLEFLLPKRRILAVVEPR
jgi:hypothetical protein